MSCTKQSRDRRGNLEFLTRSAVVQRGGTEVEHCTISPSDKNVVHVVRVNHVRNYYQRVDVTGSILGSGTLSLHTDFDIPRKGAGHIRWDDGSSIPCTFDSVRFVHRSSGDQEIKVEIIAQNVWKRSVRVDQNDLEFKVTLA
jgi:hypothetical protein